MDQTTPEPVPAPTDRGTEGADVPRSSAGAAAHAAGVAGADGGSAGTGRTRISNARLAGWFVVVALLSLAVLQYLLPALRLVQLATRDAVGFFEVSGSVGAANFSAVLDDEAFRASVGRALAYSLIPLAAALVLGPLVAAVASRAGRATRLVSRGLLAVPLFCVSPVAYYVAQWGTARAGTIQETGERAQAVGTTQAELVIIGGLSVVGIVAALSATLYLAAMRRSARSRAGWAASGVVTAVVVLAVTTLSLMVTTAPLLLTADLSAGGTTTPGMLVYEWVFIRYDLPIGSAALALLLVPTALVGVVLVALVLAVRTRVEIVPRGGAADPGPGVGAAKGTTTERATTAEAGVAAADAASASSRLLSVLSVVLVSALAVGTVVLGWSWLRGVLETDVVPGIDAGTLQTTTWVSSVLTGLVVVAVAVVGGFGIGFLRPAGRRSEWLLLAFAPFLLVGTTSLLPALFEDGVDAGTVGTLRGLVSPLWLSVPLLVLFTLVFAGVRRSRDAGQADAVRSALVPVLGLVGLSGLVTAWVHAQQYLWPLVMSYGSNTSAPILVRVAATPSAELEPVPFGLVAPLGVLVVFVVLGALCLVATDRIALRAGRRSAD